MRRETEAHSPQSRSNTYFSYTGTFSKPDAELVSLQSRFAHAFLELWLSGIFCNTGCHAQLILQCRLQ